MVTKRPAQPTLMTICVLLYGDNTPLAMRCIESIRALPNDFGKLELRIGMNEVSDTTRQYALEVNKIETENGHTVLLYESTVNRGKYPMMRWMLHDPVNPIISDLVNWLDDDSFIRTPTSIWLSNLDQVMQNVDMCGVHMTTRITARQAQWIQMQPWYRGVPLNGVVDFIVGGWWTISANILKKLNWPPPNIIHRGGDYMLGEALRQNNFKIKHFDSGIAINADEDGNSHQATRRGLDPPPVGFDYTPSLTAQLHFATKDIDPRLLDYAGL